MNTYRTTLFALPVLCALVSTASSLITREVLQASLSPAAFQKVRVSAIQAVQQAVINNGCDTNVCFALQGGSEVTNEDYMEQVNFVDVVLQIIATDQPANYAGVQYNTLATPISELTGDRDAYLQALHESLRIPGGTNIAAGIQFCTKQMRAQDALYDGDLNKIVLLGNGFATVGRDQIQSARRFITEGGYVCAVSVGASDLEGLAVLTGNTQRVLGIEDFLELSEIIVDLVQQVCNLPTEI